MSGTREARARDGQADPALGPPPAAAAGPAGRASGREGGGQAPTYKKDVGALGVQALDDLDGLLQAASAGTRKEAFVLGWRRTGRD